MKKLISAFLLTCCVLLADDGVVSINLIKTRVNSVYRFSEAEKQEVIDFAEKYNNEINQLLSTKNQKEAERKKEWNSSNPDWGKIHQLKNEEEIIEKQIEEKKETHKMILEEKYALDDDYKDK